jgi:tetratricopeptide (TPR) repeat protein
MRRKFSPYLFFLTLLAVYALTFSQAERAWNPVQNIQSKGIILPPLATRLISLEFKSIVADFLFARASQYFGGKIETRELTDRNDMQWLFNNLFVITDLDPYFEDPYYFGNALFTWDVGMVKEANFLLQRGTEARSWDFQMPFYLGFNKFYFLHEYREAADYLLIASRRPGAYAFLPTLAARLYNQAGKTESAIVFLKVFLENERDKRIRQSLEIRLDALQKMLFLERAVVQYRDRLGIMPRSLDSIIQARIIDSIPPDPYGGKFYLDKDGSIKTTSKLVIMSNPSGTQ